jgi:hypothetical protein
MQADHAGQNFGELLERFLLAGQLGVLHPQRHIIRKLPSGPSHDAHGPSLPSITLLLDAVPLDPFLAQELEIHLKFGIASKIPGLGARAIDLVLKLGSFLRNSSNLILKSGLETDRSHPRDTDR